VKAFWNSSYTFAPVSEIAARATKTSSGYLDLSVQELVSALCYGKKIEIESE